MRIEGISFPKAVRLLANSAGVILSDGRPVDRNKAIYDQAIALEAAWYWGRVRRAYSERESLRWRMANLALDAREDGDSWELLCAQVRWKRSAERWGRLLERLDGQERGILVARYKRIRVLRPGVVVEYRAEKAEDARVAKILTAGVALARGMSVERFEGLVKVLTDGVEGKSSVHSR